MPPSSCLTCGARTKGSYCARHAPRVNPARGSGPTRARFRRDTLAKTGGRCELCHSTDRVQAHHVIGLHEGGSNDPTSNGQPLCHTCHHITERNRTQANGALPTPRIPPTPPPDFL